LCRSDDISQQPNTERSIVIIIIIIIIIMKQNKFKIKNEIISERDAS